MPVTWISLAAEDLIILGTAEKAGSTCFPGASGGLHEGLQRSLDLFLPGKRAKGFLKYTGILAPVILQMFLSWYHQIDPERLERKLSRSAGSRKKSHLASETEVELAVQNPGTSRVVIRTGKITRGRCM